jgi:uncharacterized protein YcgI (DUF1989 family)
MIDLKEVTQSHTVPARTGYCFEVKKGDLIRLTDLEGAQPIDFWAFNKSDVKEFLSVEHTRVANLSLDVRPGQSTVTTKRQPIVTMVEDNSPGQHDMLLAACDITRYQQLGVKEYHVNCQDNLHAALKEKGIELGFSPQPWNLFTNFPVTPDRKIIITAPETKAGDNLILRAEMDAYIAISACPQDQNQTCGGQPTNVKIEVGQK